MNISRKETRKRFASLDQQNMASDTQQSEALEHLRQRIENTQQQINTGNTILDQISNTLRLDWLRQLGSELKSLMRRTIALNVATYHAIISIQAALPNRLERVLIEEPFILEDPIGRIAPVHLQFVTCWDAFHAVMEHRFLNLQGYKKIQQRKYGLQDRASKREIEQTRAWQGAFLPGQRVNMAIIFESDRVEGADVANTTCPGCQTPSVDNSDVEIQCRSCLIWYRRITVVQELDTPETQLNTSRQSDLAAHPIPTASKRVAPGDLEGEEDVREFKRVRLVQTKLKSVDRHCCRVPGCGASFLKKDVIRRYDSKLRRHMRQIHRQIWCPICGSYFKSSRREHNLEHHPPSWLYQPPPQPPRPLCYESIVLNPDGSLKSRQIEVQGATMPDHFSRY